MDKNQVEILKFIQEQRDRGHSPFWDSIQQAGHDKGLVKHLIELDMLTANGVFALTDKGSSTLMQHTLLDSINVKISEKYIFDSNIFDDIVSGKLEFELIQNYKKKIDLVLYLTHIQSDEIQACKDESKRKILTLFMLKISPIIIPTESAVFGTSRYGEAKFGSGDIYENIKVGNPKHIEDALIGETAIKNNLILVTNDKRLKSKMEENGGICMLVDPFIRKLNNTVKN